MSEVTSTFNSLGDRARAVIIAVSIATVIIYPQILMMIIVLAFIYILAKQLPTIRNEINKNKISNENPNKISKPNITNKNTNFCPNCGTKLTEIKNFCPNCGSSL